MDISHDSNHHFNRHMSPQYPTESFPTIVAYTVLISIVIYYLNQPLDPSGLSILQVLWNTIISIIPSRLISTLDSGLGFRTQSSKSNAIRRIIGLDGAGYDKMTPRKRIKAESATCLPGLRNWDFSCYSNSVLQSFAALTHLPAFLEQHEQLNETQNAKSALGVLIGRLNDPANAGKTLGTPSALKKMSTWHQQDAQEYFSKLSEELELDASKGTLSKRRDPGLGRLSNETPLDTAPASPEKISSDPPSNEKNTSGNPRLSQLPEEITSMILKNPLEGLLAHRVGCRRCGLVEGLSMVKFNCLTVQLGEKSVYDVRSCLDRYTAIDEINGAECYKCTLMKTKQSLEKVLAPQSSANLRSSAESRILLVDKAMEERDFSDQALKKCQISPQNKVKTTKTCQEVIARPPKSLVIHVNRSQFDEATATQTKNLAHVRFPVRLNLAPWCLNGVLPSCNENNPIENWNKDPSTSMLSHDGSSETDSTGYYELRAVITHYGRHENGHYICYRKTPYSTKTGDNSINSKGGSWWRLNDEDVHEVSEDLVLSQGGVFMLFYERSRSPVQSMGHQTVPGQHESNEVLGPSQVHNDNILPETSSDETLNGTAPTVNIEPPAPSAVIEQLPSKPEVCDPEETPQPPPHTHPTDDVPHASSEPSDSSTSIDVPPSPAPTISHNPTTPEPMEPTLDSTHEEIPTPPSTVPLSPSSMRTATPNRGRRSMSRDMDSPAGFVRAN
ncbi:ubiquitin-specific protease ubp1 [Lecanora helva]